METGKYYTQHGFWPSVTFWGGLYLPLHGFLTFYSIWKASQNIALSEQIYPLAIWLVFWIALTIFGIGIAGAFPTIRLREEGIEYKWLWIFRGLIYWEEARGLIMHQGREVYGVIISRKGFSWFTPKGLFFRALFGWMVERLSEPVLLLSKGMESCDRLIQEIKAHVNSPLISRVDT